MSNGVDFHVLEGLSAAALARVISPELSRNRHFELFQGQHRALMAFRRMVQGIRADLRHMDPSARLSCTPEPGSPHYLLRLEIPRYRVQRRIRLTSAALEVLQQDPDIGPRLDLSQDSG